MSFSSILFATFSNYGRQLVFAIAPIPAYLPQYYTLCRSSNDPVLLERKFISPSKKKQKSTSPVHYQHHDVVVSSVAAEHQQHRHMDDRIHPSTTAATTTTTTPYSSLYTTSTSSSKPHSIYGVGRKITEAGFSSTSIMILLLSHIFRLQYFIGSAMMHIFVLDENQKMGVKADRVHFDLVTQSLVMVGMQLMLLSAVTRRRRMANKRKVDDDDDDDDDNANEHDNYSDKEDKLDNNGGGGGRQYDKNYRNALLKYNRSMSPFHFKVHEARESSISQKPFIWLVYPRRYWQWDTVHQYVELIVVISVVVFVLGRFYLYPNDLLQYINTVKVVSVLLESCLALPQIILNYQRASTEGLSLVMVLGWIVGDVLKMVYFIISSGILNRRHYGVVSSGSGSSSGSSHMVERDAGDSSSDMSIFIFGCVFALVMDVIVGLQVCKYYPSRDMLNLAEKLRRLWRKFEIQVLQIDIVSTSNGLHHRNGTCLDGGESMSCL